MKEKKLIHLVPCILGILFFTFYGCYTQLATTRDEDQRREESYKSGQQDFQEDSSEVSQREEYNERDDGDRYYDYDHGWDTRTRIGFSYYYPAYYWPSYAFSVAYADPWFYDRYWAYDPWWCGTPYVVYPYGGFYSPYYHYWPAAYRHGYGYTYGGSVVHHGSRNFGSTRGTGGRGIETRDRYDTPSNTRGNTSLPTGVSVDRRGGGSLRGNGAPAIKETSRREGSQRGYTTRRNDGRSSGRAERGVRGSSSRRGSSRSEGKRNFDSQDQPKEPSTQATPPAYSVPSREPRSGQYEGTRGTREVGSSRGSTPTYTPPPPRPSSPPPSGGGARPSDGGSRGGSTRGNRP